MAETNDRKKDPRLPAERLPAERLPADRAPAGPCETCLYFDVLDDSGEMGCTVDIDEDEACREQTVPARLRSCPYYRYYDEYKLVRKQN